MNWEKNLKNVDKHIQFFSKQKVSEKKFLNEKNSYKHFWTGKLSKELNSFLKTKKIRENIFWKTFWKKISKLNWKQNLEIIE